MTGPARVATPGVNCWRRARASRVAFLVDGEAAFGAIASAIERARHTVFLVGWDTHSRVRLWRGDRPGGRPPELAAFLDAVVAERPGLHVFILSWDFALLYALEREPLPYLTLGWKTHRRVHFRLDGGHPLGASHHQKIIAVDDAVAFTGGFDLARSRWDTPEHRPGDPRRTDPDGTPYDPFHDVQAVVDGDAAASLAEIARGRWRAAGGRPPRAVRRGAGDPWPPEVAPDLRDVEVAVARTLPAWGPFEQVREIERLMLDAIAAARRSIFLETQYFTSSRVAAALAPRLREPGGPEVVIVGPSVSSGWLEEKTMGVLRARLLRRLKEADRHGRLRVVHPVVPGLGSGQVNVHSKVLVVDDALACVGSANLSNRSMGFDTECSIAVEAEGDPARAAAIGGLRDRLLAEHLGTTAEAVRRETRARGSLGAALDALARPGGRTLSPMSGEVPAWTDALVPEADVIDPERPVPFEDLMRPFVPEGEEPRASRPTLRLVLAGAALLALAAAWQWSPLAEHVRPAALLERAGPLLRGPAGPWVVVASYVALGLLMVPVTALIVAGAMVFEPWPALAYATAGSLASAAAGYALGRLLGRDAVRRLAGSRLGRVSRQLSRLGVLAIAAVRLVPVAPFTVVNLVAGATRIRFRHYMAGTLLGMLPGLVLLSAFGHSLADLLRRPTPGTVAALVLAAAGLAGLSAWLRRRVWPREGGARG